MCEHCGIDHPVFEDMAGDLLYLDRLRENYASQEAALQEANDPARPGFLPYVVEVFGTSLVDSEFNVAMDQFQAQGLPPHHAVKVFAHAMFTIGFGMGRMARGETFDVMDSDVEFPSEIEIAAFKKEQEEEGERRRAVAEQFSPAGILDILRQQGLDIPDGVQVQVITEDEAQEMMKSMGGPETGGDAPGMYL